MPSNTFSLSPSQLAELDAEPSHVGKHVLLQRFHQQYAWDTRDLHAFGSMDEAAFSRRWLANEAEHLEEAWSAYLGADIREAAE